MKHFMGQAGFNWFVGFVEDRNDPLFLGRVRVRVLGLHTDDKGEIPTEDLPWAQVQMPVSAQTTTGAGESPKGIPEGTCVTGFFLDAEDLQEPIIMGILPGVAQKQLSTETGFSDPREDLSNVAGRPSSITYHDDGTGSEITEEERSRYPRSDLLDEPDTNRLARNEDVEDTQTIINKRASRDAGQVGIPSAGHKSARGSDSAIEPGKWDEPDIPYGAVYPWNRVYESESGHVIEVDDTPGAERLHSFHRSGSFEETHPDGTRVEKVVSAAHRNVLGDDHEHIEGTQRITIDKGQRIFVNKDKDSEGMIIEVGEGGSYSVTVNEGNVNLHVTKGDMNIAIEDGNINRFVNGDVNEEITGDVNRTVGGDVNEDVAGNINRTVAGNQTEAIGGNENQTIGGTRTQTVSGGTTITSGPSFKVTAGGIFLN